MVDVLKQIVNPKSFKSTFFEKASRNEFKNLDCEYDEYLDTYYIRFTPVGQGEIVHFLDRNYAVIFREIDREIVGLMVENFEREVMKKALPKKDIDCLDYSEFKKVNRHVRELVYA